MDVASFKKSFFDRKSVTDKLDPALKKALSKFGAFVRQRDKSSLKYRKAAAAPGRPPSAHKTAGFQRKKKSKGTTSKQASSPLRELTFFGYDAERKSVVIGPAAFRSKQAGPGVLPAIIEQQHPHTGPAFQAELGKVQGDFRNLIR